MQVSRRDIIRRIERFLPMGIERRCSSRSPLNPNSDEESFRINGFYIAEPSPDMGSGPDFREFAFRGSVNIVRTDLAEISQISGEEVHPATVGLLSDYGEYLGLTIDVASLQGQAREMLRKPTLGLQFEHLRFESLKREGKYALESFSVTSLSR